MATDNKGFSLIELLVSMAILVIVGAALLGFLSYCFNQYTRSSEETTLQMESQMAQNQLSELILQTNVGIALHPVKISDADSRAGRKLSLYSRDETGEPLRISITMDYADQTLYYQEHGLDKTKVQQELGGQTLTDDEAWYIEKSDKQVFASNVEDWEVKLYDKDGAQITNTSDETAPAPVKVEIRIKMKMDEREYEATQTVSVRNTIYASDKKSRYVLAEE